VTQNQSQVFSFEPQLAITKSKKKSNNVDEFTWLKSKLKIQKKKMKLENLKFEFSG